MARLWHAQNLGISRRVKLEREREDGQAAFCYSSELTYYIHVQWVKGCVVRFGWRVSLWQIFLWEHAGELEHFWTRHFSHKNCQSKIQKYCSSGVSLLINEALFFLQEKIQKVMATTQRLIFVFGRSALARKSSFNLKIWSVVPALLGWQFSQKLFRESHFWHHHPSLNQRYLD